MVFSDKTIQKEVTLAISIHELWKRWTTSEGLKTFFGADNKIEFKKGGSFEIYFNLNNSIGERGSEGCTIVSYEENTRLTFTWNAPPNFPKIRNSGDHTEVDVLFHPIDDYTTKLVLIHRNWPIDKKYIPVFDYFNQAWDYVLKNLELSI